MNYVYHIEKWKHNRHDDNSDDSSDSDDDDWFNHTRKSFDGRIYILVVANSHFLEHSSKRTSLFSNLHWHREFYRKTINSSFESSFIFSDSFSSNFSFNIFSTESGRKCFSWFYIQENCIDFRLIIPIIHTGSDDRKRAINKNPRIEQSCKKLGKYNKCFLAENATENRKQKDISIEFISKTRISESKNKSYDTSNNTDRKIHSFTSEKMTYTDNKLRKGREINVRILIDFFDFRNYIGHNRHYHSNCNEQYGSRINKRLFDFTFQILLCFFSFRNKCYYLSHLSCCLAHLKHCSIELGKDLRKTLTDLYNILSGFDCLFEISAHFLNTFVFRLEIYYLECFDNRNPSIDKAPEIIKEEDFFFAGKTYFLHKVLLLE